MNDQLVYYFQKTRKQRSIKFFVMASMCVAYIVGILALDHYSREGLPGDFKRISIWAFSVALCVLLFIAVWHLLNPAIYEATVTKDRVKIAYPGSDLWSFDIAIDEIKRFEHRRTLSHAGRGIRQHGILLKNGDFHHVSMNYDLSLKRLYMAVQKVRPEITFSNKENVKVEGFLKKDYDN